MNAELETQFARELSAMPCYLVPCPASTWIDLPSVGDIIRRPVIHRGRSSGRMMFSGCGAACRVCDPFANAIHAGQKEGAFTEEFIAAEWRRHLAAVAASGDEHVAMQLARMNARGMLPAGFFPPAGEATPNAQRPTPNAQGI